MKVENQEKVWDEIAENWNEYRDVPSPTVENFLKNREGKLLDAGCGSGRNFKAISKDVEVYAVDFSNEMLKLAKKNAKKLKLNASFEKAEVNKLPFDDSIFDSAICIAVLHCIKSKSKRQKAIKELYRVLKKNSEVLISVWGKNSPRLKNQPKECYVSWSVKSNKKFRKGEQDKKQERYTYIYDLEELKKEVLAVGFEIEGIWEERNVNVIARKI